jgi:ABC-type hemin transport system substrate-binding protein
MPRLGRELVRGLIEEFGGHVAAEIREPHKLAERVLELQPDLVVVGEENGFADACRELLAATPRPRVLAVSAGGRSGSLWELRPERTWVGQLGPDTIRRVLEELA